MGVIQKPGPTFLAFGPRHNIPTISTCTKIKELLPTPSIFGHILYELAT